MTITFEPLQLAMGFGLMLIPALLPLIYLRKRSKRVLAIVIVSVALLEVAFGIPMFRKMYSPVEEGDDIYDEDGMRIRGYYHNYTVFKEEKNYYQVSESMKRELDESFAQYHSEYKDNFERYEEKQYSKFLNSIIGMGIGFSALLLLLPFILIRKGRSRGPEDKESIRGILTDRPLG